MIRDYSRLFGVALFFCVAVSLQACSGSGPSDNAGAPANPVEQPAKVNPSPAGPPGPVGYQGYHDITSCNAILAWAWDMNRPNDPIKLDIYDGATLIASVTADGFRQDLVDAGIGNGNHGLSFPVPSQLKDGKPHIIVIKFAGTDAPLLNGPKEITCTP